MSTPPSVRRRLVPVAVATFALGGLAGCGGDEPPRAAATSPSSSSSAPAPTGSATATSSSATSTPATSAAAEATDPKQVLQTSDASVQAAKTVALNFSEPDDGGTTRAVIRGRVDGSNQQSTYSFHRKGTFELRRVDGKVYVKGDRAYWAAQSRVSPADKAKYPDQWIDVPANDRSRFETQRLDLLLRSLRGDIDPAKTTPQNTTMTRITHQGQPALKLVRTDPQEKTTLIVSADAKHLPLQASQDDEVLTFSDWDAVPAVAAPNGPFLPMPTPTGATG